MVMEANNGAVLRAGGTTEGGGVGYFRNTLRKSEKRGKRDRRGEDFQDGSLPRTVAALSRTGRQERIALLDRSMRSASL